MSDTPKFTVVDRRKFRGDDETTSSSIATAAPEPEKAEEKASAPRLTLVEPAGGVAAKADAAPISIAESPAFQAEHDRLETIEDEIQEPQAGEGDLPPMPTGEEIRFQKLAFDTAAERLEDLVRAQNPGAPAAEKIGFEHLVQQLYLSAMMQMGAGTPEGQRPRIDILGAKQTIDLLDVVAAKTQGNLSKDEQRSLEAFLYELRMTFLELTRMISAQPPPPMPPPPVARR